MVVQKFNIEGPLLITLDKYKDDRGFFVERFNEEKLREYRLPRFIQDNHSRSKPGVLRGLHAQRKWQAKLVSCLSGRILDVIVDVRVGSETFGEHIKVDLCGEEPQLFYVPHGFLHGFCVLGSQEADVTYKVDEYQDKESEITVAWNDMDLDIEWPYRDPIVSEKDSKGVLMAATFRKMGF